MRNYFPKRPSGAPLHTLSKLYDVPVGFVTPPYFEAVYCFICGRRRVALARYRTICLVHIQCTSSLHAPVRFQLPFSSLRCLIASRGTWTGRPICLLRGFNFNSLDLVANYELRLAFKHAPSWNI